MSISNNSTNSVTPSPFSPPPPLTHSTSQQILKSKHITMTPQVSKIINSCVANQTVYRVIVEGDDEQNDRHPQRMTIVVNKDGKLIRNYFG